MSAGLAARKAATLSSIFLRKSLLCSRCFSSIFCNKATNDWRRNENDIPVSLIDLPVVFLAASSFRPFASQWQWVGPSSCPWLTQASPWWLLDSSLGKLSKFQAFDWRQKSRKSSSSSFLFVYVSLCFDLIWWKFGRSLHNRGGGPLILKVLTISLFDLRKYFPLGSASSQCVFHLCRKMTTPSTFQLTRQNKTKGIDTWKCLETFAICISYFQKLSWRDWIKKSKTVRCGHVRWRPLLHRHQQWWQWPADVRGKPRAAQLN